MKVTAFDVRHVTSWGTAMCAAVGSGIYTDFNEAIAGMTPKSREIDPDPQRAQEYEQYYRKWLSTADWLDRLELDIS
jgi:ribulose kinase